MDLITDLPRVGEHDTILTIVDHDCSKAAIFLPCAKTIDATGIANLYTSQIFPYFGIPWKVISDWDPQFTGDFTRALCTHLRVEQGLSTAYHPQTDGQSEWANQRVEQYLCIYGNTHQNNWPSLLPMAQFMHNTLPNVTMGQTPCNLLYGFPPSIHVANQTSGIPEVERRKEWLE